MHCPDAVCSATYMLCNVQRTFGLQLGCRVVLTVVCIPSSCAVCCCAGDRYPMLLLYVSLLPPGCTCAPAPVQEAFGS